jgi:predicted RNase H-like HicB family nuclease
MRTYSVILEPAEEGGYVVTVPALPEVGTQGDTREEALANAREAIQAAVETRISAGEQIPPDCQPEIERVSIAA